MQVKISTPADQTVRDLRIVVENLSRQAESLTRAGLASSNPLLRVELEHYADRLWQLVAFVDYIIKERTK